MNEDGYLEDRIGIEVMNINAIKVKQTSEKIAGRQTEAEPEEGEEDHDLVCVRGLEVLFDSLPPVDELLQGGGLLLLHHRRCLGGGLVRDWHRFCHRLRHQGRGKQRASAREVGRRKTSPNLTRERSR